MELLQLKYFCDAAVSENFSQTAKKFGVPPSDISQSIRRLERELNTELFLRRANSIALTDKGRQFYLRVSKSLAMIEEAIVTATDKENTGKIKICINCNRRIVMEVVEKYRRTYPDVEIITTNFKNPISEDYDIIIDSGDERLLGYNKTLLITEKIVLAMNEDSRFAKEERINIAELSDEAFITMNEKSSFYQVTNSICKDFGFAPKIAIQSDDPFYIRKCVELGLGVCFVPAFSWQGQFSDSVIFKEIEGYKRNTYIFTDPKKRVSLCTRRFIEMLLTEIKI